MAFIKCILSISLVISASMHMAAQEEEPFQLFATPGPAKDYKSITAGYGDRISTLYQASFGKDGFIYLADAEKGLLQYYGSDVKSMNCLPKEDSVLWPVLKCFCQATDGTFHGIDTSGRYLHFRDRGTCFSLSDDRLSGTRKIVEAADGTIWFFSDTLYFRKDDRIIASTIVPGLYEYSAVLRDSYAFFYRDKHEPWMQMDARVDARVLRADLLKRSAREFVFDRPLLSSPFVATDQGTLLFVDVVDYVLGSVKLETGEITRVFEGRFDSWLSRLMSGEQGRIYLIADGDGIYRIRGEKMLELEKIGDEQLWGMHYLVDTYEQTWAFSEGQYHVSYRDPSDSTNLVENVIPGGSLIQELKFSNERVPLVRNKPLSPIRMRHDLNRIDALILPSDLVRPGNETRARLLGVEEEWQSERGRLWYIDLGWNGLSPGKYVLEYQSRNPLGAWCEPGYLDFRILRPWWKSILAITLYLSTGLISIVSFFMFRERYLRKENIRLEQVVEQRTREIRNHMEEIEAQRDEIEAQRDLLHNQNTLIMQQKQDLTDSIDYAVRIQESLLPDSGILQELLPDHFVLFRPKDVVSGDFYWFAQSDDSVVIVGADCTGHGVPGALISMLGMTFLDEIVKNRGIVGPASILDELRDRIILALRQEGRENEVRDGMDIVALTLRPGSRELLFAGAKNPLYVVAGDEILVHKGDRFAVSYAEEITPFTEQRISLEPGGMVYLFSDGFPDQFGGPDNKKYKYKPFREFLHSISDKPTEVQHQKLQQELADWMGEAPQIDDILVMGIRV